ncbi:hypothetical protein PDJAM_G00162720 [Pangasius djambal]|uniref:Uncharacterized protein n=1 Tax=Pangasius djambal TaxID=1691987 RepID=A0ACC5ZM86_9TELE|nr:hypothetical protein [Pangasius djambal]
MALTRRLPARWRLLWTVLLALWASLISAFNPSQDSELTFLLPAGSSECFYQSTQKNGTLEVEYQVIAGAGMDVDFTIISPHGILLASEFRRSDGVHMVEPTEAGDYQICFDNSFSRFSEKMVFFEVILENAANDAIADDEWAGLGEPENLLEYKLEDIRVIAGAGMDVDFTIISPHGILLASEFRRSDGVHMVEPTEAGDYQICFDNSFSRFSEKMVFFEVILENAANDAIADDEWAGLGEPENLLEYKLEDIRESIESVHRHLERSRQMQTVLRAFEARDRNLLEDNLWRVSFWSCTSLVVMLTVACTQVYTLRRLFDDKRKVRS